MNTVESIKHLFLETGAGWVLWLLAGLSIASVAIVVERWLHYLRAAGDLHALSMGLQQRLSTENSSETVAWLQSSGSVAARVAAAGLKLAQRGPAAVHKAMVSRTALEREDLDRRLAYLGTLGNNAPFIGLFGTVIGIIQAFEELGHSAAGHSGHAAAGAASQVASGAVMSAIAEALVVTAVGIAVALPAVAAYNYLQRRVEHVLAGVEVLSNLILAYLESEDAPDTPGEIKPNTSPAQVDS
ncbi:MAG: biopolymer transporter ExbB [Myxococcales bacterium]|nr:biopolymer transporter ExbB [Myxococcales bacterium]